MILKKPWMAYTYGLGKNSSSAAGSGSMVPSMKLNDQMFKFYLKNRLYFGKVPLFYVFH